MTAAAEESLLAEDRRPPARRTGRIVLVAAAFLLGLGAGWAAFTILDDSGSDTVTAFVTPGSDGLSERQAEMVDLLEEYMSAWKATDGRQLEAVMVDDGYVEYAEEGWRFEISDGSLQARVSTGPYASLENYEPVLVYEDRIVLTGRVDSIGVDWLSVIRFTTTGEVKVVSETIYL